jgi:predicted transglutaminase-like cysteine proteinase
MYSLSLHKMAGSLFFPLILLFLVPSVPYAAADQPLSAPAGPTLSQDVRNAQRARQEKPDEGACLSAQHAESIQLTGFQAICVENTFPETRRIRKYWEEILERHNPEKVYGKDSQLLNPAVRLQWNNLSKAMPTSSPEQKLQYINGFFNRWPSANDIDNFGEEEYWASPEEFMEKGGGDCEDYAIIKYLALHYFSWPAEDLWVVLVTNKKTKVKHAALAARNGKKTFILCNLSRPAYLLIPEKQYMENFTPLFALNGSALWAFTGPDEKNAARATPEGRE